MPLACMFQDCACMAHALHCMPALECAPYLGSSSKTATL